MSDVLPPPRRYPAADRTRVARIPRHRRLIHFGALTTGVTSAFLSVPVTMLLIIGTMLT